MIIPSIRKRVLLVDDEEDSRILLQEILAPLYEVDSAASPRQAMLKLATQRYDVVVMDILLGEIVTGLDVTLFLRARSLNRDIPVVAMTGYYDKYPEHVARFAGASHYLPKPMNPERLLTTLANC